jgi:hypothetical protein
VSDLRKLQPCPHNVDIIKLKHLSQGNATMRCLAAVFGSWKNRVCLKETVAGKCSQMCESHSDVLLFLETRTVTEDLGEPV